MNRDLIVILVTVGSRDEGARVGRHLVDARLAACVNIVGPIRSLYRWQGEVQNDEEWQLLIKTRVELFDAVAVAVREVHSYDTPEIVALPVHAVARAYGDWVVASTREA